jgi:tetratricopeptide (TPR) repeat protein
MAGRIILLALLLLAASHAPAAAQADDLQALRRRMFEHFTLGEGRETVAVVEEALETDEGKLAPHRAKIGEWLVEMAVSHIGRNEAAKAEPYLEGAAAIAGKMQGEADRALAQLLLRIAHAYGTKRIDKATPFYRRALDILERANPDEPKLPQHFFSLGYTFYTRHRYAEAQHFLERAVALAEKQLGPDAPVLSMYRDLLPRIYEERGLYVEAERALRRNMAALGRRFGSDQQDMVRWPDLEHLARLYTLQGHDADADRLFARARRIKQDAWRSVPRPAHENRELAARHLARGRYAEAEAILSRELARYEEALARNHETQAQIAAIGDKLRTISERAAREPLLRERSRLRARLPSRTEMAGVLRLLAKVRRKQGLDAEAEPMLQRAITLLGEDADRVTVIPPMLGLADLYADQERYADAEQLFIRALQLDEEGWRRAGRPPDAASAAILNRLGRLAAKRKRLPRAEQLHKRALGILEERGPTRVDVGLTLVDLAEVYRAQARYAEAEPLLKRALELAEKGNLSPGHRLVGTALASLVALYQAQGRNADADRLKRAGPHAGSWVR